MGSGAVAAATGKGRSGDGLRLFLSGGAGEKAVAEPGRDLADEPFRPMREPGQFRDIAQRPHVQAIELMRCSHGGRWLAKPS
jgi:hypothetical protein